MDNIKNIIKDEIEIIKEDFYKALKENISIPSEKGEGGEDEPFGEYPKKALEHILNVGKNLGFNGEIVNNAVAYLQYGEGEDYIGVVGHLDVVEAGNGWDTDPYNLVLKDGKFYARGILDNKGPIIANLFGLYILKRLNIKPKNPIRIIFGSDEESGSNDIPMYLKNEKPPIFGYTPDCKYPVVYGERGIVGFQITTNFNDKLDLIEEIKGEFNSSFIPDYTSLKLKNMDELEFFGKKSPSNAPELGENSILLLADYIRNNNDIDEEIRNYFSWLYISFKETDGNNLNIKFEDIDSGTTQVSLYSIKKENEKIVIEFSTRYPINTTEEEILSKLNKSLYENSKLEIIRSLPSKVFPKDDKRIEKLTKTYEEFTGLDGTPVTTTGATYARTMPNIVAFGPSFPGQKGIAHKANEYMDEEDLIKNLEIYTLALYYLAK